ncbi:unnamed protein product, partial [Sphacelaria rigidula]
MDETLVHQLRSAYSYFLADENGVVQDGIGRTSATGLRLIMVHAITEEGPLVSLADGGQPIEEGSTGDYHDAMTDKMFEDWLKQRLEPAFKTAFPGEEMILVLDNASCHHSYDAEIRVPVTNTKAYNTDLLRKYKAKSITEKVEKFMDEREWKLIWTPPYMPTFQPIGLFWLHGKQYVS